MGEFDVLFVDDEPDLLDSIKTVFEIEGVRVYCVKSGEDALEAIKENSFNMILTDLNMTGISGLDLAGKVKEMLPGLPVYLLTGNVVPPKLVSLAKSAGVSRIFTKPVSPELILNIARGEQNGQRER